jgi:very-short-patch-repair endonuclease
MKLCAYGCGQEGKFLLKNGKFCCSESCNSCEEKRRKISKTNKKQIPWIKGKHHSIETKEKIKIKNKFKSFSIETKQKMSLSQKERYKKSLNPMFGKKHNIESKQKMRFKKIGFVPWNKGKKGLQHQSEKEKERCRQFMLNGHSAYMNSKPKPKRGQETKEKHRKYMLNGGAVKALKGVKNPSKPEVLLRELVKNLYPECEFQYPILNYSLDVAIPDKKIAIEYDGYYHFNTKENKEYHKLRQKKIEKEGWKFLRYTMFDEFPTIYKLEEDIKRIIL